MEKLKLFGKRIKELRKSKNYTQEQLAEILGIYQKQIGNIETGSNFTTMPNLEKLADTFGVQIMDLFDFDHEKTKEELETDIINMIKDTSEEKIKQIHRIVRCLLK